MSMTWIKILVTLLGIHFMCTDSSVIKTNDNLFPVAIIHLNDFHARFDETDLNTNPCESEPNEPCIGGYARVVTMVKQLKQQYEGLNPIYLNVGDNFQGTLWYNLLRWNVTSHFLNLLPADVMTIGNHEFDHGIEGLVPFLEEIKKNTPIVVSNIDDTYEPTFKGLYEKSTVIEKYGRKIGVIGAILTETKQLSKIENLILLDEIENIKIEAEKMKNNGIDIVIVLSHCGLTKDRKIASALGSDIDIIVGGHSHTFMYTGENPPGPDTPEAQYPEIFKTDDQHEVLIVQASAYTKYLGNFIVWFDDDGNIVQHDGSPIFMDNAIVPDPDIVKELQPFKEHVDEVALQVIGDLLVELDIKYCSPGDCAIGNLIADSYVYWYALKDPPNDNEWTVSSIALTGGARSSVSPKSLNYGDLKNIIPYDNTMDFMDFKGEDLWDALEIHYGILQVSGLKIVVNSTKPVGERLQSILVLCNVCEIPEYQPLNKTAIYHVIINSYVASGMDGFDIFLEKGMNREIGDLDIDALELYVKNSQPIITPIDDRIKILT